MMEAGLLKNLVHPNIVEYKESFLSHDHLTIIMEYCEVGDLAYHIKRKQQKNETFSEQEIFHWMVQICMALEYVHSRKVLHRDIKTQNVFLTGANTIKLGDFGISKVLESTTQVAMTVVGTPYYMSPESCQSEPQTSKSDIWALGVIVYELCTLTQPFQADNLLGLVFKIVQDTPAPIPSTFSPQLQELITKLMAKDPAQRPSSVEILQMPYVRERLQAAQELESLASGVFVKQAPTFKRTATGVTVDLTEISLTPQQRLAQRKAEAVLKREQELKNAAHGAIENYEVARNRSTGMTYEQVMGVEEEKKGGGAAAHQMNANDERPINAAGSYDLDAFLLDNEIEEVQNFQEVQEAQIDRDQLDQVQNAYLAILQKEATVNGLLKKMTIEVEEDQNKTLK